MVNTSTRRTVSRPGVNGESGQSNFQSPYQPPPALPDFHGDISLLDANAYQPILLADDVWRVKVPLPSALADLSAIAEADGGAQIKAINGYLRKHMHPDDFQKVLRRLLGPDDPFSADDYMELYRLAVTRGTARPFQQSWGWPVPPPTAGASSARSSRSAASRHRSRR